MCNLYSLSASRETIARLFKISDNRAGTVTPLAAIFPGHPAPVIRRAADGERELQVLSWGFVLPQAGKAPRRVTNTRDDKALASSFWRESISSRRCLVPATAFAEPHDGRKPATWHWFAVRGDEPRPLFAFAGLWRHWKGPIKKDGPVVELDTFSFMTTAPNELTRSINHERSPVLLTSEAEHEAWLNGDLETAMTLVKPLPGPALRIVQEGFDKADLLVATKGPASLQPGGD